MQKKSTDKAIFTISFLLLFLAQPAVIFSADGEIPQIVISEIAAYEPSDTEWVEIYNNGYSSVNLTGWKFFEEQTNHGINVFQGTSTLNPAEYAVIANKADLVKQKYPQYTGTIFDSSWGTLKEEGEEIGLKNASGNMSEVFTYPQTGTSTSLERMDLNLAGSSTLNWENHPTSNSIGQARQITQATQDQIAGTTTETATSITDVGTSTPVESGTTTQIVGSSTVESTQTEGSSTQTASAQTPTNSHPVAVIQIQSGSLTAYEHTTINFDGRASSDPNGDTLIYIWDMGDGTTETTANPSLHAYDRPGIYTVTLTVIDEFGAQNRAQQTVNVLNKPVLEAPTAQTQSPPPTQTATSTSTGSSIVKQTPIVVVTQNIPPQPAKAAESKTATQSQSSLLSQLKLPQTEITLKGYFVFVPSENVVAPKTATKKNTSATTAKKPAGTVGKPKTQATKTKVLYKNGDISNAIKITEILPNPNADEGDQEWIELFNADTEPINLGNWKLADGSKKTFSIPDSATLEPGAYKIFQKSETSLALNNGADSVFLYDFNDNLVDTVAYEKSQKGYSYALIDVKSSPDLVASTGDFAPRAKQESAWEWTAELSPEAPNPSFEKVEGVVSRLLAGGDAGEKTSLEIKLLNGDPKIINFNREVLDPLIAGVVMKEGTSVNLRAQKREDGSYALNKIEEVHPAPIKEEQKSPMIFWAIIGIAALSFSLNVPPILKALKNYLSERRKRMSS
ncbi:lamin tail domain-containing protein [Candidatus Peregrinibacteria bacterium]|nr:lamin tail domain-containing protein [Candidatus Peregrinibacteria bacterium]